MPPGGYFGRALVIDLDDGEQRDAAAVRCRLARDDRRRRPRGPPSLRACPGRCRPLAPDAPLVFVFSPLVGTPLTTSAKFAVVAKSPLTDRLNDALASSHFAISGKLTGNDAIVVRGACDTPSALIVDAEGARVVDAVDLWGLTAADAEHRLREQLGPAYRIAAIGQAGERLVRYATVSHDGRHAGRGGLGAVMGAKRLKAIAVRAATRCPVADRRRGAGRLEGSPCALVRPRDSEVPRARARSATCLRSTRSPRCRATTSAPIRRRWRSRIEPPCATAARRARSAASGS